MEKGKILKYQGKKKYVKALSLLVQKFSSKPRSC